MDETWLVSLISALGVIAAALVTLWGVRMTNRQAQSAEHADAEVRNNAVEVHARTESERIGMDALSRATEEYRNLYEGVRKDLQDLKTEMSTVKNQLSELQEANREALRTISRLRARVNGLIDYVHALRTSLAHHGLTPPDPPLDVALDPEPDHH